MIAMRPIAIAGHCRHVRAFYLSNAPGVRGLWAYVHMHQCLVAAFALACAKKKRIISRLASGPLASV